jgi:ribosomal protein S18 acetylase RimI-like enzyme
MLLARLGVDNAEKAIGIGRHLVQDAMKRVLMAARHVAARTLLVHALNDKAAAYYRELGFVDLPKRDGQMPTLHLTLGKIVAALKAGAKAT